MLRKLQETSPIVPGYKVVFERSDTDEERNDEMEDPDSMSVELEPHPQSEPDSNFQHTHFNNKAAHNRQRSFSESALLTDADGNKSPRKWRY